MSVCRRVKVHQLAPASSEDSLRDFFSFCGDIRLIQVYADQREAVILFETESGASTAVLLDNAVVDGGRIRVEPFPEADASSPTSPTGRAAGSIPSNSMMDEVLTETMNIASNIGKTAKQLDEQYAISNKVNAAAATVTTAALSVDEKYHVSENAALMLESAKQGALDIDSRYKITETVNGWMGSMLGWKSPGTGAQQQATSPRPPSPAGNNADSMVNRSGRTPPSRSTSPGKI